MEDYGKSLHQDSSPLAISAWNSTIYCVWFTKLLFLLKKDLMCYLFAFCSFILIEQIFIESKWLEHTSKENVEPEMSWQYTRVLGCSEVSQLTNYFDLQHESLPRKTTINFNQKFTTGSHIYVYILPSREWMRKSRIMGISWWAITIMQKRENGRLLFIFGKATWRYFRDIRAVAAFYWVSQRGILQ